MTKQYNIEELKADLYVEEKKYSKKEEEQKELSQAKTTMEKAIIEADHIWIQSIYAEQKAKELVEELLKAQKACNLAEENYYKLKNSLEISYNG